MTDQLRNVYVTEIARDIGHLTGSRFEEFGYRVLSELHPAAWAH